MSEIVKRVGVLAGVLVGTLVVGCAADAAPEDGAPGLELDSLDEQDQGTSFNGWTQHSYYLIEVDSGFSDFRWTLTRSSGDATRGGGACVTRRVPNSSCSSDANCAPGAVSRYGSQAWGYCYSGVCYDRPGGLEYCTNLGPSHAPGNYFGLVPYSPASDQYVVACMTKTAGPNFACGGTNSSLYMRSLKQATYHYGPPL